MMNKKGITLVETLVGIAILMILMVGVIQLTTQSTNNSQNINRDFEINEFMISLGDTIRDKEACTNTFRNLSIPVSTGTTSFTQVRNKRGDVVRDLSASPPAPNSPELSKTLKISKLQLQDGVLYQNATETNLYRVTVFVQFLKGPGIDSSRLSVTRTLPVILKEGSVANTVDSCYTDENSWYKELCQGLLSGRSINKAGSPIRYLCADINIKNSVSTDGSFCFNKPNGNASMPGDPYQKYCVGGWDITQKSGCSTSQALCPANTVNIGVTAVNCGKNCTSAINYCCPVGLPTN